MERLSLSTQASKLVNLSSARAPWGARQFRCAILLARQRGGARAKLRSGTARFDILYLTVASSGL
jgi:hypothetical protein